MATVTTKKTGFREISGLDSDHFDETTNEAGHTVWIAKNDGGLVGIGWGKDDVQFHGTDPQNPGPPPPPPLKTGSTVEEWTDATGKRHAVIKRAK